jgi:ankyrin repeat protein
MKNLSKNNPILSKLTISKILPVFLLASMALGALSLNGMDKAPRVKKVSPSYKKQFEKVKHVYAAANLKRINSAAILHDELQISYLKYRAARIRAARAAAAEATRICLEKDARLIKAVYNGDATATIELLINGADVNARDSNGNTALMIAIFENHATLFEILIAAEANINLANKSGRTALIWAILFSDVNTVRALLERAADVNVQENSGDTALIWAACNMGGKDNIDKSLLFVELLLNYKADVNKQNHDGRTALVQAVYSGTLQILHNFKIVEILINAKSDVTLKDKRGYTALQRAKINAKVPGYKKTYDLLCEASIS